MKSIATKFLTLGVFLGLSTINRAQAPEPEAGFRWVLNPTYSDEFNGTTLDKTKWRDTYNGWKGRAPAKFDPSTVSVTGGNMVIRNKPLDVADGAYTIAGGAVQSLTQNASFGYYECRFKASKIAMSTTFWMYNSKQNLIGVNKLSGGIDCPKDAYSQELDICESIGGVFSGSSKFRTDMNFNTHYRHVNCNGDPEKFYSAGNNAVEGNGSASNSKLSSESWQDYHTYGCYWKSPEVCEFYADANLAGIVKTRTDVVDNPFNRAMGINMVTETYDWAKPYPTNAQLNDNSINASYYDWIRAYTLVPVDQVDNSGYNPSIYQEKSAHINFVASRASSKNYSFLMTYQANVNRDLHIIIKNQSGQVIKDTKYLVLAGYGKKLFEVALTTELASGNYTVSAELRPADGDAASNLNVLTKTLTITGPLVNAVDIRNPPVKLISSKDFTLNVIYTTDVARDVVLVLTSPAGTWLGSKAVTVQAGSATIPVTINLAAAPVAGVNYKFSVNLRTQGGDWSTNIAVKDVFVELLSESACLSTIVKNGCFENNNLDNWAQWGAGTREVITGANVAYGNYSAKVSGIGAIEQVLTGLTPNTTYILTANAKIEGTQFVALGVKEFDGTTELSNKLTNTSYQEQSIEFTTSATATSAKVFYYSSSANGIGYIDNISLAKKVVTASETLETNEALEVYPNPTSSFVTLSKESAWTIISLQGIELMKGEGSKVDMSNLSVGVYLLQTEAKVIRITKN
jgi:hypothetical protein